MLKLLETVIEHVAGGEKVLVGSCLKELGPFVAGALNGKGIKANHITEVRGEGANRTTVTKSPKKRAHAVREFIDGDARVLCAGVQALKVGHSLEVASAVCILGLPDSWVHLDQFLERVHRLTSTRPVNVHIILPRESMAQEKHSVLQKKGNSSDLAFDGQFMEQEERPVNWEEVIREMRRRGIGLRATADLVPEEEVEAAWRELAPVYFLPPAQAQAKPPPVASPARAPAPGLPGARPGRDHGGRAVRPGFRRGNPSGPPPIADGRLVCPGCRNERPEYGFEATADALITVSFDARGETTDTSGVEKQVDPRGYRDVSLVRCGSRGPLPWRRLLAGELRRRTPVITAYRARDAHPPTDPRRNVHGRESDHVSWDFERVRSLVIEGTAKEFGPVRRRGGPGGAETEDLEISVEIDFENDADPEVSEREERFAAFLYALENRDVGHLLFEVDRTDERAFLEGLSLAFLSVYDRGQADPPRIERRPRAA